MPKRILGIDPGSRVTGFGVISTGDNQINCIAHGCIKLSQDEFSLRMGFLLTQIQELIETYQPTEVAIEDVFVHKNARAALKLGQARGVAVACVIQRHLPLYEYAPRQVKQAVVGKGQALKSQVQHMVKMLLKLEEIPPEDASDALALAICHANVSNSPLPLEGKQQRAFVRRKNKKRATNWRSYDQTTSRKGS